MQKKFKRKKILSRFACGKLQKETVSEELKERWGVAPGPDTSVVC